MNTITHTTTLTVQECCNCHVLFGMPHEWDTSLRESHAMFYCPAGHGQHYTGKTEAQKLSEKLKEAEQRAIIEKNRLNYSEARLSSTLDQLGATQRSLTGHKAAKTRIKNRIAAGVCPCCNRSFQNVARHMAGQHPTFATKEESNV